MAFYGDTPKKPVFHGMGCFFFFGFPKHSYIFDFIPKGMMIQMNFLGGESTKRKKVGERLAEDPIDSF
jgi:hypothetical protein